VTRVSTGNRINRGFSRTMRFASLTTSYPFASALTLSVVPLGLNGLYSSCILYPAMNRRATFKGSYGTIAALKLAHMMREGVPAKQDRCCSSGSQFTPRPGKLLLSFGRRSSGFHLTHSAERLVPFPGNHKRCRNQEQCHNTHKDVSNKVWPLNCSGQPFRD
jgi:hypothetical protein